MPYNNLVTRTNVAALVDYNGGVTLTLVAYQGARWLWQRTRGNSLASRCRHCASNSRARRSSLLSSASRMSVK